MKLSIALAIVSAFFASNAHAQTAPRDEKYVLTWMVAAAGADLSTTAHCLGAETCRELGGLKRLEDRPLTFGFTKMAIDAAKTYAVHRLYAKNKWAARVTGMALGGVSFALAAHNAKVTGQPR